MELPALGTILCPVDLSGPSRAALYTAAGLAQADPSRLVVLRAGDVDDDDPDALKELDGLVTAALPSWPRGARLVVRHGGAAPAILGAIEECGADVVIAGTRGRGALGRAILGSTAADLLRESPVPLMVVPPSHPEVVSLGVTRAQAHVGIILAAVDMTAGSERQIAWAAGLTPASDHRLLLLHVVGDEAGRARALERMNAAVRGVETARGFRLLVRVGGRPPARCCTSRAGRRASAWSWWAAVRRRRASWPARCSGRIGPWSRWCPRPGRRPAG